MKFKYIATIGFFVFTCTISFAQFVAKNIDIAELQKRTLFVLTLEPEEDENKEGFDHFNLKMKEAVEKYWPYNKDIEYGNFEKATELNKSGSKKYVVLRYSHVKIQKSSILEAPNRRNRALLSLGYIEKFKKRQFISFSQLSEDLYNPSDDLLTPMDLDFALNYMVYLIELQKTNKITLKLLKQKFSENSSVLPNKTLLFDKDRIDKNLTEEAIKEVYPYPFKITDKAEISKVVSERNSNYAFIHITPASELINTVYTQYVVDASNMAICGISQPTMIMNFGIMVTYGYKVEKADVKRFFSKD